MNDPYSILEVAESASDEEINSAYLRKVREYPPEQEPERFQMIRDAFETIRTVKDRLHYQLFCQVPPDLESVLAPVLRRRNARQRPTEEVLLKALAASVLKVKKTQQQ